MDDVRLAAARAAHAAAERELDELLAEVKPLHEREHKLRGRVYLLYLRLYELEHDIPQED